MFCSTMATAAPWRLTYSTAHTSAASRSAFCTSGGSLSKTLLLIARPPANIAPKFTLVMYGATSCSLAPQAPVAKTSAPSDTPDLMSS